MIKNCHKLLSTFLVLTAVLSVHGAQTPSVDSKTKVNLANPTAPNIKTAQVIPAVTSATNTSTADSQKQFEQYLSLNLTHTIFQGILAAFYQENAVGFDPQFFSRRIYFQTFINKWSQLIESGEYRSTEQIFTAIKNSKGYLGKHFSKWEEILSGRGGFIQQFLGHVLYTEKQNIKFDARAKEILKWASLLVVTQAQEYELGSTLVEPFLYSENVEVRNAAQGMKNNIPFQKRAEVAMYGWHVLEAAVVGGNALKHLDKIPKFGSIALNQKLLALGPAAVRATEAIARYGQYGLKATFNANTRNFWSVVGSLGLHAGVGSLFYVKGMKFGRGQNSEAGAQYANMVILGNLWDSFNTRYPGLFPLVDRKDFYPKFIPQSQNSLVASVNNHMLSGRKIDYGDIFIRAEKINGIDELGSDDFATMDIVQNRYFELKAKTAKIFGKELITQDKLNQFRKLVIEDALALYKRDYPNLTANFLEWGGNCVTQTMLMVSLLEPYQSQLPVGTMLTVSKYPMHIEASLWDGVRETRLQSGIKTRKHGAVYRPQVLMATLLNNLGERSPVDAKKYLVKGIQKKKSRAEIPTGGMGAPDAIGGKQKDGGSGGGLLSLLGFGNNSEEDARFGVLEGGGSLAVDEDGNMVFGDSGLKADDVPYAADQTYTEIVETETEVAGNYGDLLLNSGSKANISTSSDETDGLNAFLRGLSNAKHSQQPKAKVWPDFNYQIRLDTSRDYKFRRVTYNVGDLNNNQIPTVTAFDQNTFMRLTMLKRRPKINDNEFTYELQKIAADDAAAIIDMPVIRKFHLDPMLESTAEMKFQAFTKITELDMQDYKKIVAEHCEMMVEHMRLKECTGDGPDFAAIKRFSANLSGKTSYQSPKTQGIEYSTMAQGDSNLIREIIIHPRKFLISYGSANIRLRNYLLKRFFGSSFWEYNSDGNNQLATQAKFAVRNFLANLSDLKIDLQHETNWICSRVKIDLPKASKSRKWPWLEIPDAECGPKQEVAKDVLPAKSIEAAKKQRDTLELRVSILFELTIGFGRGLHLWNQEAVDAFVHGRYDPIGPDRNISKQIVKNLLETDPELKNLDRYLQLRGLK